MSATKVSQAQSQQQRIISIQVCRGIAALLVVLTHIHGIEETHFASHLLRLFGYGDLGVDLFFVISGIVIASVTAGRFGSSRNAAVFLYHRLARIFPIFWIYTTLSLLANRLSPHPRPYNLPASYLLVPAHIPMLLFQGWTLSFELYFYLAITLLLLLAPERIVPWLLALWGIVIVVLKLHIGLSPIPIIQLLTNPSTLEFLAGYALFHLYRRSRLHPAVGVLLLAVSLLWLTAIILHDNPISIVNHPWKRPLLYGSFATLFLYGAMELERTQLIRYLPSLRAIGDWSYSIYLSHVLVLNVVARVSARFLDGLGALILLTVAGIAAVLVVGYLSFTYIERPLIALLYQRTPSPRTAAKQPA